MRHEHPSIHAGQKHQPPGYRFETADYEQLQAIWVGEGTVYFSDHIASRAAGPGTLLLLRMGSAFSLHTERVGYRGVCCVIQGAGRPEFRGPSCVLEADFTLRTLAQLMERELKAPSPQSRDLLLLFGQALCHAALRLERLRTALSGPGQARALAASVRHALDASLYGGRGAREVLSALPLSYRQLSRHFTACYRVSPKEYQLRARIEEAERLLAETHWSVTELAHELGFSSSQHFSTQFHCFTGMTPKQWRHSSQARSKA